MNTKYRLDENDTITIGGVKLFRVVCVTAFDDIAAGERGGYIESERNLQASGNAWVYGNAQVYDDARVYGNARVYDDAQVYGNAWVYDDARVYGNARVYDDARVYGNARVYDDARVCGNAQVYGNARVYDDAWVYGNAQVYDDARVCGNAQVYGNARVCGNAWVYGNAQVYDDARVYGNAQVYGNAWVRCGVCTFDACNPANINQILKVTLDVSPVDGRVRLFKRVKANLHSCHDDNFVYPKSGLVECDGPSDWNVSCGAGMHFSTANYWNGGDVLIAADIPVDSILAVADGKVRCSKAYIVGVCDE